ncbi:ImmA/IrrE family metallo-endopeptidase [Bradyrhizobium liaoningense]|jgi:Zn-dependent peptidase ImmA (M78 family)|nr:XRE family transcriptional regulator [Bradyrhizobium japonicum]MBR0882455.1 ImmA/IrrE family metallo-endopeptidase [Bradyrhizobium liaoningense]MBR1002273.1 ImmA/IrrE family metallo-endopeptidase [Bradyrhizobium liaoningense]MBR1068614.1 ImmA/IrrE family metallo-endopeptidase [Bradyrhizobium liaoningense]WLB93743.1 XRE family transcriptional regulator [Bradyrhizobium japonicum USDA 123]
MPSVNPDILRWARETAGLSAEDAAAKLDLKDARGVTGAERLAALEAGEREPSRPLLVRMAKHYRRPLLAFYMAAPPTQAERGEDFRTLPPEHSIAQDALVDALIRDVRARQQIVREALEEEDAAIRLPFVGSMTMRQGANAVLASIVETLNLDLERYRRGTNRQPGGFAYLRHQAEQAGIYVLLIGNLGSHHTSLDVETFRGFALADEVAPFVVVNDQDAQTAWAFTLLHELCHIWLGATGVSGAVAESAVEQFCNDVAGRFLLPSAEIETLAGLRGASFESVVTRINDFAEQRNISRSMVAYKLLREGLIDRELWSRLTALFRSQWKAARASERERNREREGGPNYYVVRRHRLGDALVNLTGRMLAERILSPTKAGKVLGVKASNVYGVVGAGSAGFNAAQG